MFHNIKTKVSTEIHSVPMDYKNGEWVDGNDHILSEDCPCSPKKLTKKLDVGNVVIVEEIYNHHRPNEIG